MVVIILAVIFFFAPVPDIKTEDDYHLDDKADPTASHFIWSHPHFVMAVAGYVVPMACFAFVAVYGFLWPKLSGVESMQAQPNLARH